MSGLVALRLLRKNILPKYNHFRCISTSNKKSDVSTASPTIDTTHVTHKKEEQHHWQSYGFNDTDEVDDLNQMHSHGFFYISLGICVGAFIIAYRPDVFLQNWSQREAFLELRRRETHGLPLIDPNYVDPSSIVLPSDEELGDFEIII